MKKLLAFMLVFAMIFALAACDGDSGNESSNVSSTASQTSTATTSKEESKEQSKEESKEQSKEESKEQSQEESSTEPELPAYIDAFVHVCVNKSGMYGMKPTDASSIRITKIDDTPVAGDVVCFTPMFGAETIAVEGETYADYAILVAEYNQEKYQYLMKAIYNLDDTTTDKSKIAIPADGFVLAIHKDQKKPLAALAKVKEDIELYPSNFQPYEFTYDVKKTDTPFEIDGKIGDEWKSFLVDKIDENNLSWDYSQFDLKTDSPITADYYLAYDDNGVYIGLVVNSAACKWMSGLSDKQSANNQMYSWTCIQVNTLDQSPLSDYMIEHAQGGVDHDSYDEDHLRQYGFSGSDDGKSYYTIWMGGNHKDEIMEGSAYCAIFDEANETITYEVYLPYAEINIDPAEIGEGFEFSVSISINSTTVEGGTWKNIRARNGGGIIGMNEFTKMPVCVMSK